MKQHASRTRNLASFGTFLAAVFVSAAYTTGPAVAADRVVLAEEFTAIW